MNEELKQDLDKVLEVYPLNIDKVYFNQNSKIQFENKNIEDYQEVVDYFNFLMNKYSDNTILYDNLKNLRDSFNHYYLVPQKKKRNKEEMDRIQEEYIDEYLKPLLSTDSDYNSKRIKSRSLRVEDLNPELTDKEIIKSFSKLIEDLNEYPELDSLHKQIKNLVRNVKKYNTQYKTLKKSFSKYFKIYLLYNNFNIDEKRTFLHTKKIPTKTNLFKYFSKNNIIYEILPQLKVNNNWLRDISFDNLEEFIKYIEYFNHIDEFLTILTNKDSQKLRELESKVLYKFQKHQRELEQEKEEERIKKEFSEKQIKQRKEEHKEFKAKMGKYSYQKNKKDLQANSYNNIFSSLFLKLKRNELKSKLTTLKNHLSNIELDIISDHNEKKYYEKLITRIDYYFEIIDLFESLKKESVKSMIEINENDYSEKDYRCLNIQLESNDQLSQLIYEFLLYQPFEKAMSFLTNKPIKTVSDLSKGSLHDFPIREFKKEEILETTGESYSVKTIKQGRRDNLSIELFEFNKFKQKKNNQLSDFELRYKNELYLKHALLTIKKLDKIKVLKNEKEELEDIKLKTENVKSKFSFNDDSRGDLREAGKLLGEINSKLNSYRRKYYKDSVIVE